MTAVLLALDAGTSVIKAVAFEVGGHVLAQASRPNAYDFAEGGGVEQDMRRSWADAAAVLAELVAALRARDRAGEILALAITGQGDGTWLIDAAGEPVGKGLLWLDARAAAIVAEKRASGAAAAAFAFTGTGLAACQQSAQFLWLARHRPEMIARAATALHPKDYLYFRATGKRRTSPCEGSFTFGDFRTRAYRREVLEALDLTAVEALLPPIADGTMTADPLSAEAARETGLAAGLPVVLGYVDVLCAALGAGLYGAGEEVGVSIIGSTGMHMRLVADVGRVRPSPAMTGYCMAFPVPGHTMQAQSNMAATLNIDWLAEIAADAARLAGGERPAREALLDGLGETARHGRPGAALFHPFISTAGERGPFTEASARASLIGLDQTTRFGDIARAVFEGLAFAARDCYMAMGDIPAEIRMTGGAARSATARHILASVLARPVSTIDQPEAGSAGAAMIAALATGIYPDMKQCVVDWVLPRLKAPLPPDAALVPRYDALFPLYRQSCAAMMPIWRGFASGKDTHTQ